MKGKLLTFILACLTLAVLTLSMPMALHDAFERGGLYLFSREFIDDMPRRFSGPGGFRFIVQPVVAIILGIRNGLTDARARPPPYLYGIVFHRDLSHPLIRSGFENLANLLLLGILLDSIFQWLIYGISHPGAALVVGPTLIIAPYAIARALTNRTARMRN